MAFRHSFARRLFHCCKILPRSAASHHAAIVPTLNASKTNLLPDHLASPRRAVYHSGPSQLPEFLTLPVGDKLRQRLRDTIRMKGDCLRLDGLRPPPPRAKANVDSPFRITVSDARKILRLSRVERLKERLREIPRTSISHSEYIEICVDACESDEEGARLAKMLDDSGNVIVLGNVVFLRPQQVAETMESLIGKTIGHPDDPRRTELEEMEKQKALIDEKARALVRGELYCGLAFLVVQTLAFMRLTFWELTWDVMEPICFFVTSFHFSLAYLFFLKTSTEPSFQGYFLRRFITKQQRLMNTHHFDARRYHDLCSAFYPNHHHPVSKPGFFSGRPSYI